MSSRDAVDAAVAAVVAPPFTAAVNSPVAASPSAPSRVPDRKLVCVEDDEGAAAAPLNDEVLLLELVAPVGEAAADAWRAASVSFNLSPEDKRWLISEPERSKDNASAA
jgi:hypothetical protein